MTESLQVISKVEKTMITTTQGRNVFEFNCFLRCDVAPLREI
jgi:hypothetical protein